MLKIIIINGKPRSGKTTFEELCQTQKDMVYYTSTVTFVKELAKIAGWDGTKTPKNRKFLSNLKDLLTEWNDVPLHCIEKLAKEIEDDFRMKLGKTAYLFVDCREPKEIEKLKNKLNAVTLLIRRPSVENEEVSNHADADVFNYDYDYEIVNDSTIEELTMKARDFLNSI